MKLEIKNCKVCPLLGKHYNIETSVIHVWCEHPRSAHKKYREYKVDKNTFTGFRIGIRKPPKHCPLYHYPIELEVK